MTIPTEIQEEFRDAAKKTLEQNGMRMEDITIGDVWEIWHLVWLQQTQGDDHPAFVDSPLFNRAVAKVDPGADFISRIRELGCNADHIVTMLRSVFGLKKQA